jgi:putative membrane protein
MSYDLFRGLHIIAMVAWMAGLLILPRLYVYHLRAEPGSDMAQLFTDAERRLLRLIMNPAMLVTWVVGLGLIHINGQTRGWAFLLEPWMMVKLLGVVLVTAWHGYLAGARKRLAEGRNTRSERFWRVSNELPFVAAIAMILAVTTEFG